MVEKLAARYGDQILFAKCNADDCQQITAKYGIKSIPTLLFFKDGSLFDKISGMTNQAKIEEVLKKILAGEQGAAPFIVQYVMVNYCQHGFWGVIAKPYNIDELGREISKITK